MFEQRLMCISPFVASGNLCNLLKLEKRITGHTKQKGSKQNDVATGNTKLYEVKRHG